MTESKDVILGGNGKTQVATNHMSQRNGAIDILRLVFAFLIVFLHFPVFPLSEDLLSVDLGEGLVKATLVCMMRLAVPFFFMVTGFYLPTLIKKGKAWSYFKKLAIITLLAFVLYSFRYVYCILTGQITLRFGVLEFLQLLLLNGPPFANHLWFLLALLYDVPIYILICKYRLWRVAVPVIFIIYGLGLAVEYMNVLPAIYTRNFLFRGLPCLVFGSLLYRYTNFLRFYGSVKVFVILFLVFLVLNILETMLTGGAREMYLMSLPVLGALFCVCFQPRVANTHNIIGSLGRKYSSNIYILHMLIGLAILPLFADWMLMGLGQTIVFVLSLLCAGVVQSLIYRNKTRVGQS